MLLVPFIALPPARGRWSQLAGRVAEDGSMMHVQSLVDDGVVLDAEVDFVFDPSITRNLLSCPIFDRFVWSCCRECCRVGFTTILLTASL